MTFVISLTINFEQFVFPQLDIFDGGMTASFLCFTLTLLDVERAIDAAKDDVVIEYKP